MVLFFADTCFLVAMYDENDNNHDVAHDIWEKLSEKKLIKGYNNLYISDYIITEVFHLLQNTVGFNRTLSHFNEISKNCNIVRVSYPETINKAINLKLIPFCSHKTKKPRIGLVDATSLIIMDEYKINRIISFDGHFKNLPFVFPIFDSNQLEYLI